MATLLRGKRKGQKVKIHQFCNDWFMLGDGTIVSPSSLEFTFHEVERIMTNRREERTGGMFTLYGFEFNDNMTRLANYKMG